MITIEIGPDVRNAPSMSFLFGWAIPIRSAKKNIKPIFLQNRTSMRERGVTPTLKASLNSIKLLSRYSNISRDRLLVYTYIPLYKMAFQIARTYTGKNLPNFPLINSVPMRDGIWRTNLFLHGKLDVAQIPEMHNFLQKKTRSSRHILSIQITLTTSSDYRIIAHNQQ